MRAAVMMPVCLCLASAEYLKHCHLPTGNMRHSCTFNELITSQWCGYRQHVTFHFFHHNRRQWDGQRATGHLFPPWCHLVAPMRRSYHVRMHQMMHLGENWLQKRKHALNKIVQVQSLSRVWTMSVDDVVKRKCQSSYCFLYKTVMCV